MLVRLAESLYWMGRYLERLEYLVRYLNVQYFSTMESPINLPDYLVLSSLINVSGSNIENLEGFNEEDILLEVGLNEKNPNSIINCIIRCRENAKAIRPSISNELWESINAFYHFITSYDKHYFKTVGLFDFASKSLSHASMFKALCDSTLLHDEAWYFIKLGQHIESSVQITRILSNKLFDINQILEVNDVSKIPMENYQWVTTLKILEGLDISRKLYHKTTNRTDTFEFAITNVQFTRSLAYNLEKCHYYVRLLTNDKSTDNNKSSIQFKCAKLAASYKFLDISEVEDFETLLYNTNQKLAGLHNDISTTFFLNFEFKNQRQKQSNKKNQ